MRGLALLFSILLIAELPPIKCSLLSQFEFLKFARSVTIDLMNAWDIMAPLKFDENAPVLPFGMAEKRLMLRMRDISREVDAIDRVVKYSHERTMQILYYDLPQLIKYELRINNILQIIDGIENMYNDYEVYLMTGVSEEFSHPNDTNKKYYFERHTLESFANAVVSPSANSVRGMMDNINLIILKSNYRSALFNRAGLFHEIRNLTEHNSNLCNIEQSPQQLLFNLYSTLQIAQLKAYTMIQFSWILLRLYDKGNFTTESEMMRERYLERMLQQAQAAKEAMKGAKQELWKCDPKKHKEGETYTELTKILQGFIVNEVDLNDQMTCKEDCGAYSITKQHGCYKDGYCKKQQACRGTVVDCKYVDSDMWVCPSDANKRRYDWIEYENGHTLGMKKSCSRAITKVDSWWRWVFWHCSYCFCLCDDQHNSNSDRYFNLRPITSNISQNKVVSGIRFVKVNQVIHLQIQEADMSAKGSLNGTSVAWKPVDAYFIKQAKEGQDYHTITYKERAIDLDDLFVPDGHVLTGVRFRKVGTHLNFEIQASPYNYTSGILSRDRSQWISNDNTDGSLVKPRKKLVLDSPDLPTRSSALAEPDSSSDQYLEFTNSDIDSDAAQSTVPFIDIQPVAPKPPVPLSGAGIYHKGNRWFGGFIAPKVFTLDFSAHLQDNFPEINEAQKLRK